MLILNDGNDGQLLSFYQLEIDEYLKKYLQRYFKILVLKFDLFLVGPVFPMFLHC